MPELPEVETTLRGISPHIKNQTALKVIIRQPKLRWLIPTELPQLIEQHTLQSLRRRAKYLLLNFDTGTLLIHLGMSGSLRVITDNTPVAKHDHFDIQFTNNKSIRLTDPRRFGAVLWLGTDPESHPLLSKLGPEPLGTEITANYLYQKSRSKKVSIKQFLMNQDIITGIGNIYCTEALYTAGINPVRAAGNISLQRYQKLLDIIQNILTLAIEQGGTTLRDFVGSDGKPGYFKQELNAYGRAGQPCKRCQQPLSEIKQAQRTTVYCSSCQT
ncbi:formamidopyrimidine-DNA glycosylase [Bathymodiolus platifrons methanotrophic gill symbiont]|uniref:bifunctional DNA-formamidopyrimidine glycosylase/DNA-(apurinic or apyrimidinic site) lyase n=1 Tax=Bathymodiolus platifrons methanotrophic gill symbiont TaxID=113268 RepID=UPI000B418833|nr:bifunctional DNA-formamidopyrimidine glycosylase/DNA-(apurinic or apyrimidinic site) lyase [Bathymodiolus platifrons methanotrophic gill symbiont]MCK5870129.1 bifunctional DNA-formamidopyrimidine glycosylase/DNA-(apurinic or apyrimidinic site) lyase [Methyloprofundus sp.]TXK98772.1 DNA-formamidopyrimidine glycosylase [Methylococcaceae bacterium CS4]TXL00037.1 DNA-formamidopyrimidine glycosylase [Methylococcaceae bacterium CS5]TXL06088.1 DNA-formamidopyrimidine glycosylase [Methylococcaceae b